MSLQHVRIPIMHMVHCLKNDCSIPLEVCNGCPYHKERSGEEIICQASSEMVDD